ncbi:hypothetical protein EV137_4722 [Kribbella pratensis]|uniref:EcsC family protein n=1 Tax=Kribbella pratensis TaxID=2512112 RepID=A0ABY2FHP2_9ACTN|nr:hypothetical protein [Kribbella pratensis]TDW90891.1 hypothetical protein EV137_4722 [Kribbella pratensis]
MIDPKDLSRRGFEKALMTQQALAVANVARLRRVHPDMSPRELLRYLDRAYLIAVTTTGGAAGATAVVPGAGIPGALVDMAAFTEASVLYALSCAEVHGLHSEDLERRRLLVLTVLMGDSATGALRTAVGRTGPHWARRIVTAIPITTINRLNKLLGPRFITKYGTRQGLLVLSKQVPLGIGVVLGGAGNHLIGRGVVASARTVFGGPPNEWEPGQPSSGGTTR